MCKPNRAYFEKVLSAMGKKAEECVYVDDNANYLPIPLDMGMQTIHVGSLLFPQFTSVLIRNGPK